MSSVTLSRMAGAAYLLIIACGITAELALRGPLIHPGDAGATLAAVIAHPGLLRGAILLDCVMVSADVVLAVLLFQLLRSFHETTALTAMAFRLLQAATIAASLLALVAVDTLALRQGGAEAAQVAALMELHGIGYDLGLVFFAVNTGATAWLLARSGYVSRLLPPLLAAAALVYLAGSVTRIAAPEWNALLQPAYAIALIAETWLAVALVRGFRARNPA